MSDGSVDEWSRGFSAGGDDDGGYSSCISGGGDVVVDVFVASCGDAGDASECENEDC